MRKRSIRSETTEYIRKLGIERTFPAHVARLRHLARCGVASGDIRLLALDRDMAFGTLRRVLYDPQMRESYLLHLAHILGWDRDRLTRDIVEHGASHND